MSTRPCWHRTWMQAIFTIVFVAFIVASLLFWFLGLALVMLWILR